MTRSLHLRQVIGPVLGLAGFAIALAATSTALAQDGTAPAGSTTAPATTSEPAPAPAGSTAPAATTTEDEEAKKKAAAGTAAEPATTAAAPAEPATTPAAPATGGSTTTVTFGTGGAPKKDEPSTGGSTTEPTPKLPWYRGSMLIFDQSMSANTLKKDAQLSYMPSYEWWISPRVNYNFSKELRVTVRQDVFKEWTNVNETTEKHEWLYSDTWLSLSYRPSVAAISKNLTVGTGLQLRPGISKESRIAGQYLALGPVANVNYNIELGGEKAKAFKALHVGAGAVYTYAFSRCNGPCATNGFSQPRMNTEGQVVNDTQVRTASLTGNQLIYTASVGVDILERLDWSGSMIWISQFAKDTTDATFNGQEVVRAGDDTRLRQFSWWFTQFSYGITKEFTLAAGYWNMNRTTAPDGKYRNPFWSPDARLFVDVYFHLDAIYEKLLGGEEKKGTGPKGGSSRVF